MKRSAALAPRTRSKLARKAVLRVGSACRERLQVSPERGGKFARRWASTRVGVAFVKGAKEQVLEAAREGSEVAGVRRRGDARLSRLG